VLAVHIVSSFLIVESRSAKGFELARGACDRNMVTNGSRPGLAESRGTILFAAPLRKLVEIGIEMATRYQGELPPETGAP
jgi:hypothetical protein